MSTMNDLAKRIRSSNKAYFAAGMEAGKQKVTDLFFVAAHELGMLKSPAKAKELLDKMEQLDAEYGVAWQGKPESDEAIHRIDSSLKKLCGPFFQPFFERNDTIKDWWDKLKLFWNRGRSCPQGRMNTTRGLICIRRATTFTSTPEEANCLIQAYMSSCRKTPWDFSRAKAV